MNPGNKLNSSVLELKEENNRLETASQLSVLCLVFSVEVTVGISDAKFVVILCFHLFLNVLTENQFCYLECFNV